MTELRPAPPSIDRIERRRLIARTLSKALDRAEAVQALVAATIGTSETRFRAWLDPDSERSIALADVLALPPAVRRALTELLAESLGCVLADQPAEVDAGDAYHQHAWAVRESGELLAAHALAIADGRVDASEGALLEREAEDVIRAASAIRELGRAAQRAPGRLIRLETRDPKATR